MRVSWVAAVVCVAGSLAMATGAEAQDTQRVVVGPQYDAGGARKLWFGAGYRELWTTPIDVPVLDLRATGGGLTPVRVVGQAQSLGLALRGADGRSYTFRSLHKHPERILPAVWRDRWPGQMAQDQTSGTHPGAALVFPPLAEAVGVPFTTPRIVVMPDDAALGEFRGQFAHEVGTIDEFPLPGPGGTPGFMGATEIISSTELWKRWLAGPENRVDSRALLRARVLDLFVDNYDRHAGQWRWMRIPGKPLLQPLPEDFDFVLVGHDGLVSQAMRSHAPQFLKFSDEYTKHLEGPLRNSFEVDRWLLADLDRAAWETVAAEVAGRLTDEVIERALRQLPPEWFAIDGADKIAALRTRRAGLVAYVLRAYRYEAETVDVHATDRAETVTVARGADDSIDVSIAVAGGDAAPYYRRRFLASESDEIRIYLHGGDDRVTRTGAAGGPIRVRVIGGGGADVVDDSSSGGTDVWRDAGTIEVARGRGTRVRQDLWVNASRVEEAPWLEARNFGRWSTSGPIVVYSPDYRLFLGYGMTRTAWGFRTEPVASVQSIRGGYAVGDNTGKVEYVGTFRRPASNVVFQVEAHGSGIDRYNFFGLGNDSPREADRARYRTRSDVLTVHPTVRFELGRRFEVFGGPEVRYSQSATGDGTVLGEQAPLGTGDFGLVTVRAGLHFDSRERPAIHGSADLSQGLSVDQANRKITGLRFTLAGFFTPQAWSVDASYGGLDGEVAAYVGVPRLHAMARVGGRRVEGDYAWFDAASLGGRTNHGYLSHRFLGDSSAYGSVGIGSWLGTVPLLVPVRLGVTVFADAGRVWVSGETSDTLHTSVGGGLMLQPLFTPVTLHAMAARGKEGTRVFFGFGYPF